MIKLLNSQIVPVNEVDDFDDLASLIHIHEAALLASLRSRLSRGMHHTWAGDRVLIATRPLGGDQGLPRPRSWQPLPSDDISPYTSAIASRPPHIHTLAESLYRRAVLTVRTQTLLLLGGRAAGKSYQLEQVVRYLCCRAAVPFGQPRHASVSVRIEVAVLAGCAALCPLAEIHSPSGDRCSQRGQSLQA